MYYIKEESFNRIMAKAEPMRTSDPWAMRERLREYPVVRYWDSGEAIGPSSGQWEEQARLIDTLAGEMIVETQAVYYGERHGNKPPRFFRVLIPSGRSNPPLPDRSIGRKASQEQEIGQ